jgi:hypothetical protein
MECNDRKPDNDALHETPEEAARAIANALEFLRGEAAAVGLHDVGMLIELAHATLCAHCPPASSAPEHH